MAQLVCLQLLHETSFQQATNLRVGTSFGGDMVPNVVKTAFFARVDYQNREIPMKPLQQKVYPIFYSKRPPEIEPTLKMAPLQCNLCSKRFILIFTPRRNTASTKKWHHSNVTFALQQKVFPKRPPEILPALKNGIIPM